MVYQVFLSPQRNDAPLLIIYMVYKSCVSCCETTEDLGSQEIRKYQESVEVS